MASLRHQRRTACGRKRRYPTMTDACAISQLIRERGGDHLMAYGCPVCHGFHLGHKPGWLHRKERHAHGC